MDDLAWLDKHIAEQQASHLAAGITPQMFSALCEYQEAMEWEEQALHEQREMAARRLEEAGH